MLEKITPHFVANLVKCGQIESHAIYYSQEVCYFRMSDTETITCRGASSHVQTHQTVGVNELVPQTSRWRKTLNSSLV